MTDATKEKILALEPGELFILWNTQWLSHEVALWERTEQMARILVYSHGGVAYHAHSLSTAAAFDHVVNFRAVPQDAQKRLRALLKLRPDKIYWEQLDAVEWKK